MTSLSLSAEASFKAEVLRLFNQCLTCPKGLTDQEVRQNKLRCHRCQREYERDWPSPKEFNEIFQGQA